MKKNLLFAILIISSTAAALAQDLQDVIHLKNGSIVRGIIIEQIPNKTYKIETSNGSLFIFDCEEIVKISKDREVTQMTKQRKSRDNSNIANEKRFSFGVKAGLSLTTVRGDVEDIMPRVGCVVGFTSEYMIAKNVSLGVDILYSQQGYQYEDGERGDSYYFMLNDNFSYLNIPMTISYYIANGFALKAGLQPGFMLNAKRKFYENIGNESYLSEEYEIEIMCKTFDLAIPIGLSYNINRNIVIDARYNIGMINIPLNFGEEEEEDYKLCNNAFQLTVGLKF